VADNIEQESPFLAYCTRFIRIFAADEWYLLSPISFKVSMHFKMITKISPNKNAMPVSSLKITWDIADTIYLNLKGFRYFNIQVSYETHEESSDEDYIRIPTLESAWRDGRIMEKIKLEFERILALFQKAGYARKN
jgi:hypothetical protein